MNVTGSDRTALGINGTVPGPTLRFKEGEDIVTLEDFLDLWAEGTYRFRGMGDGGEMSSGMTQLTYDLPAAPQNVDFVGGAILWSAGDDLGNCATAAELSILVGDGVLSTHPEDVVVDHWEVVFEPDTEDGDPLGEDKFTVRVPGDISPMSVTVPAEYLASLPDDIPVKVEVGAIGGEDNATFSEEGGFCANEVAGCEED